jgi:hypothetical protein
MLLSCIRREQVPAVSQHVPFRAHGIAGLRPMRHEQSEEQHLEYVRTSLISIYVTSSSCVLNIVLLCSQHEVRCRQYVYWQLVLHEVRCRQYIYWQLVLCSQHVLRCMQYLYWQLVLCSQHVRCRQYVYWQNSRNSATSWWSHKSGVGKMSLKMLHT